MFGQRPSGLESLLYRPPPTTWQLFLRNPCVFLAQAIYSWHLQRAGRIQERRCADEVSVVCLSDTHNMQCPVPDGDILIHAGDLTQSGTFDELQATILWLRNQPHRAKLVIAGNHDLLLDNEYPSNGNLGGRHHSELEWGDVRYLQNSQTTVECANGRRLTIYGSPLSPRHGNWAFQYSRDQDIWAKRVPDDTDILVTHSPPRAHLDLGRLGCESLLRELWRVHPALHIFGHVHAGYGEEAAFFDEVQSAYERTIIAGGGICNLVRVLAAVAGQGRTPRPSARLVNASIVGGLRDDERRKPMKVHLSRNVNEAASHGHPTQVLAAF
ncbi:Metallo-dependent phosphatase-like protein [Microdochium bolleyi]|uniref:Metallo-dependent phosphatase-like protein n=1 Tax=Microdochium bolleyi TaxID=196109 RepID=A0A136IZE8_9PEZI|nr:Metallo-dependent phosphatase-like protein [Microdochium bolleyi]